MTTDAIVTALRVYVIVVSVLVAVIGTCQYRRWLSYLAENQLAWLALAFFNLAAFFGSVQTLHTHQPGGSRNYVVAIAVTFALYAVTYPLARAANRRRCTRKFVRSQTKEIQS